MKNIPLLVGTILLTLAMIGGIALVFSKPSGPANTTVDMAEAVGDARRATGPEDAQVTVVEFSDFQCPACNNAEPTVKALLAQYPEDMRLVYRHFPLDQIHPYANLAARASEVAAEYDKFWEMHDKLFETQTTWSQKTNQDEVIELFATYAEELEIDKNEFLERIESESVRATVLDDQRVGFNLGVNSTPTFVVNGQVTSAPQLQATVESLIQNESTSEDPSEESVEQ